MSRMRFGIFMAPFHSPAGQNPTTAFARDVATVQQLDRLGYDEAWIGEHHSCGTEIIASPEIFIAHLAAKTDHIKLGTGVLSLPYHNPLWVADRAILLDHLTRGRFMLGLGPGALPTDAAMIGIDPSEQRQALEEDADGARPPPAQRRADLQEDGPLRAGRGPLPAPRPSPTRASRSGSPPSPHRRGRAWPASTASACCRSARR